ncbi:MAG: glutamine--fructose-6-phosphate transaminase (isomerizing) [Ruminococcaceae bacterium]|nr:glutamine--fructose-6-phosphate transaminase (isomerizing) [Oscillospiraceae bacterium]
MCGIIGYIGNENAVCKLTEGLSVLEYRGYDSVGIAVESDGEIKTVKCRGRIDDLKKKEELSALSSHCGIGHTRWATHGAPSDTNAHPHRSGRVTLVHNGIIENYKELKKELEAAGKSFVSETDSEIAAGLLDVCYLESKDPVTAILQCARKLTGSYALGILFEDRPGEVYAVRCGSPLLLASSEDGCYLASDMTAFLPFTKKYYCLAEGEIACLSAEGATVHRDGMSAFSPAWSITDLNAEAAQKGGYPHFMLKEIFEQPRAIVNAVSVRARNGLPDFSHDGIDLDFWRSIQRIQIVACGSAMHAGLVGAGLLEHYAKIPTTVHVASEYRYNPPLSSEGTLVLLISQSGETADTLAALRYAKSAGLPTLAIVNAVETTIAREADRRIYTYAGPEIAVATTKGYCTQAAVLYMIAAQIALARGKMTEGHLREMIHSLLTAAPAAMERFLSEKREQFVRLAGKLSKAEHMFYIGRGLDYSLSMEASLKLKEISYIHAESYAAGELKHGTISLVEEGTPVIAIMTERDLYDKTESNVREVASRGAYVILICREDAPSAKVSDDVILLPGTSDAETLFCALAAVQMLAYETARARGCDIDRPRNLAKSVTVE